MFNGKLAAGDQVKTGTTNQKAIWNLKCSLSIFHFYFLCMSQKSLSNPLMFTQLVCSRGGSEIQIFWLLVLSNFLLHFTLCFESNYNQLCKSNVFHVLQLVNCTEWIHTKWGWIVSWRSTYFLPPSCLPLFQHSVVGGTIDHEVI